MLWLPIEPGQQDLSSDKGSKTVRPLSRHPRCSSAATFRRLERRRSPRSADLASRSGGRDERVRTTTVRRDDASFERSARPARHTHDPWPPCGRSAGSGHSSGLVAVLVDLELDLDPAVSLAEVVAPRVRRYRSSTMPARIRSVANGWPPTKARASLGPAGSLASPADVRACETWRLLNGAYDRRECVPACSWSSLPQRFFHS
jgi:hypothetical protein